MEEVDQSALNGLHVDSSFADPTRITDLLSELRAAGAFEEEGTFTLDRQRSARLLGRYQFDDPLRRVTLVLSAAVASDTPRVEFKFTPGEWSATFAGKSLSREDMAVLSQEFSLDLLGHLDARVRCLAMVVLSAVEVGAQVRIESGALCLDVDPRSHMSDRVKDDLTQVVVHGDTDVRPLSAELLLRRCSHYVPVHMRVNGRECEDCPDLTDTVTCRVFVPPSAAAPYRIAARLPRHAQYVPSPGPFGAVFWVSRDTVPGARSLTLLVNGCAFHAPLQSSLACEGIVAVPHLHTDLSLSHIVTDNAWKTLWQTLQIQHARFILEATDAPDAWRLPALQGLWPKYGEERPADFLCEVAVAAAACGIRAHEPEDSRIDDLLRRTSILATPKIQRMLIEFRLARCRDVANVMRSVSPARTARLCAMALELQHTIDAPENLDTDRIRLALVEGARGDVRRALNALDPIASSDDVTTRAAVLELRGLLTLMKGQTDAGCNLLDQAIDAWRRAAHAEGVAQAESCRNDVFSALELNGLTAWQRLARLSTLGLGAVLGRSPAEVARVHLSRRWVPSPPTPDLRRRRATARLRALNASTARPAGADPAEPGTHELALARRLERKHKLLGALGHPWSATLVLEDAITLCYPVAHLHTATRRKLTSLIVRLAVGGEVHPRRFWPRLAYMLGTHRTLDVDTFLTCKKQQIDVMRCLALRNPELFRPRLAISLQNMAYTLQQAGRHPECVTLLEESIAILRECGSSWVQNLASSFFLVGQSLMALGRADEAAAAARASVEMLRPLSSDPACRIAIAQALNSLAWYRSDHSEGLTAVKEAVAMLREASGPAPEARFQLAAALDTEASILFSMKRDAEARASIDASISISRSLGAEGIGAVFHSLPVSLNTRARILSRLGLRDEARDSAREALEIVGTLKNKGVGFNPQFVEDCRRLAASTAPD